MKFEVQTEKKLIEELEDYYAELEKSEIDCQRAEERRIATLNFMSNIPERKKAEEERQKGYHQIELILNSAGEGILGVDLEGKHTFVNPSALKMLGYEEKELLGQNSHRIWHHTRADGSPYPEEECPIYGAFKKGTIDHIRDEVFWRKDGSSFFVAYTSTPIKDDGKIIGAVLAFWDITERKQMVEALRQSEERHRTIIEQMGDGYFEVDLKGQFTFVNDAECRNLGYSKEELIGLSSREYADENNVKELSRLFSKVYRTGEPIKAYDLELIKKDGTKSYDEISASLIRNSKGDPIGFRGVSRNVTERKQMEEKLRQSEERYRNILESIEEGYYEVDIAGNLTFFNDSLCNLLGYSRDELMGLNSRRYTDEQNAVKLYEVFNEVYRTGIPAKSFDWQVIRKDGTTGFGEVSVSPIWDGAGNIIGFRGIARDITDRKRLEEALKNLSLQDDLTGLYNRRGFFALAEQGSKAAQRNGTEMLLIYGDLDNFKEINDTFGHQEGDQVLRDVSHILKETFRESDIVARMGGDEFVILAMNTNEDSAEKLIIRFEKALKDHHLPKDRHYTLSISLGVACFNPQKSCSIEALLTQADKMMYENKQKRKTNI